MAFRLNDDGTNFRTLHDDEWKNNGGLVDVVCTGNGCTLYRMSFFDKVQPPWFLSKPGQFTEDVHFFSKARVQYPEYRAKVDTTFSCGHLVGNTAISSSNYRIVRAMSMLQLYQKEDFAQKIIEEIESETEEHKNKAIVEFKDHFRESGEFYRKGVIADAKDNLSQTADS
jgi:hypothetical protein